MAYWKAIQLLLFIASLTLAQITTPPPLMSPSCPRNLNGKSTPSAEPNLHQCKQYACESCCSENITKELAIVPLQQVGRLNFQQCNHTFSTACSTETTYLECFYQCSPNLFPWIDPITKSLSKIPLCSEFCDMWFLTCKADQTCVVGNGNWKTGLNYGFKDGNPLDPCKAGSTCRTYEKVYGSGKEMCDNVWGNMFYYSDNHEICMNPSDPEHNSVVIDKMNSGYQASHCAVDQVPYTDVGLIVGVVFGVLAAIFIIVAGVAYYMRTKKGKDVESGRPKPQEVARPEEMTTLKVSKPDVPANSAGDSSDAEA